MGPVAKKKTLWARKKKLSLFFHQQLAGCQGVDLLPAPQNFSFFFFSHGCTRIFFKAHTSRDDPPSGAGHAM